MNDAMTQIHKLSKERQILWSRAGHGELDDKGRARIQRITDELYQLWDQHRREIASQQYPEVYNTRLPKRNDHAA